jgi:hypothetical protein
LEITASTKGTSIPDRYGEFNMDISLKADLSEEHYQGLVEECNNCFVGNTIKNQPDIIIGIKTV